MAVSKTRPIEQILPAIQAGLRLFGENRVQELVDKYDKLPDDIRWHLIGHLQTNKVKYIVDKVYMIHSVESLRLAQEISKEAVKKKVTVKVLVEVNIGNEDSKFGLPKEAVIPFLKEINDLPLSLFLILQRLQYHLSELRYLPALLFFCHHNPELLLQQR